MKPTKRPLIRVRPDAYATLRKLADRERRPMATIAGEAIELYASGLVAHLKAEIEQLRNGGRS